MELRIAAGVVRNAHAVVLGGTRILLDVNTFKFFFIFLQYIYMCVKSF